MEGKEVSEWKFNMITFLLRYNTHTLKVTEVYKSVVFSTFTRLHNYTYHLIPEHSTNPQ